jgi:hypothetical protein
VTIDSCDLTGRRMYVRVRCEAVQVPAPALLAGYRSPFTGARKPGGVGRRCPEVLRGQFPELARQEAAQCHVRAAAIG